MPLLGPKALSEEIEVHELHDRIAVGRIVREGRESIFDTFRERRDIIIRKVQLSLRKIGVRSGVREEQRDGENEHFGLGWQILA